MMHRAMHPGNLLFLKGIIMKFHLSSLLIGLVALPAFAGTFPGWVSTAEVADRTMQGFVGYMNFLQAERDHFYKVTAVETKQTTEGAHDVITSTVFFEDQTCGDKQYKTRFYSGAWRSDACAEHGCHDVQTTVRDCDGKVSSGF